MFSGSLESVMKLSVISPNTTHKRGSVVPLTIAITDPTKMSNLSQPSAKRNYTRKHQQQQSTAVRYGWRRVNNLVRLAFGSLNRSIEWAGGNFPSAVSGWCWRISNGLSRKRTHEVQTGHYALTAGDLRSPSKQQEEVQHSHPLSLRSPPTSYTNLSHTHT